MRYLNQYKMTIKLEDVVFWILIASIIAVAIWILIGSPPFENGLLMIIIFVTTSEILIWRKIYTVEKNTVVGFMKVKNELNLIRNDIGYIKKDLTNINKKLNNIENLIKRKK